MDYKIKHKDDNTSKSLPELFSEHRHKVGPDTGSTTIGYYCKCRFGSGCTLKY